MKKILSIVLILSFNFVGYAQLGSLGLGTAKTMGLSNALLSFARGAESIGSNPANIMLDSGKFIQFSTILPNISSKFSSNGITLNDYQKYFEGTASHPVELDEIDKEYIMDLVENDYNIKFHTNASLLSIVVKPQNFDGCFGFAITDYASSVTNIPKSMFDLALYGNQVNRNYSFDDFDADVWWLRSYSFNYAQQVHNNEFDFINQITLGVGVKYVQGFAYFSVDKMQSDIFTDNENKLTAKLYSKMFVATSPNMGIKYFFDTRDKESSQMFFPEPAGSGFGGDLGISFLIKNLIGVSVSITDIGKIVWDKNAAELTFTADGYYDDVLENDKLDSLLDLVKREGKYVDQFSTHLPTALRIGTNMEISRLIKDFYGSLIVGVEYTQGLVEAPSNSMKPRFGIAALWEPGNAIPAIATGLDILVSQDVHWSLGLGLVRSRLLDFYLSTNDIISVFSPNSSKKYSVAANVLWKLY